MNSLIITLLNEEESISQTLESIKKQTRLPDEIVIVDGGSKDKTLNIIKEFQKQNPKLNLILTQKIGNRSIGRNEAIRLARGEIILCTDAGCLLNKDWVKLMLHSFTDKDIEVVAGYYAGISNTVFEKCLIPYVLVMPDRVEENNFLPATRSMGMLKKVWQELGGFPKHLKHNEDYVFAQKIKAANYKIIFNPQAKVYWLPPRDLPSSYIMFYRFALGDAESRTWRVKALLIVLRYLFGGIFVVIAFIEKNRLLWEFIFLSLLTYIIWAVCKNYRYVKSPKALYYLPFMQFVSDIAVIHGTLKGVLNRK